MTHHYSYGSGYPGCLYDYGPNYSPTLKGAIDSLVDLFGSGDDLSERALLRMRRDLRRGGIHYFADPVAVGAAYCEVTRQPGPCPEGDES